MNFDLVGTCFTFGLVHVQVHIHIDNETYIGTMLIVTMCATFGILNSVTFH